MELETKLTQQQVKFIKVQNIGRLEKEMRKTQKGLRRLKPKVQKAANNYNRISKTYQQGVEIIKVMEKKRDQLLLEFKEDDNKT